MHITTISNTSILGCQANAPVAVAGATADRRFSPWDVSRARRWVAIWVERVRTRHQLAALDNWMLQDIGISRAAALRESRKAFWQA